MKENGRQIVGTSLLQVLDILFPIIMHFIIFQLVAISTMEFLDAGTIATVAALITAVPAIWLYRKEYKPAKKKKWYTLWIPFVLGILGNLLFSVIMSWVKITETFSNETQEALFQSNPVVQLIGIGVLVPIVEEMIFRGLVWGKLRKYFGSVIAALFSALLFALYHGNMIQMLYAFPMGLLLALTYEKWGMFLAPVLLHIGANLLGVLSSLLG